jgi:hypothetical protein
MCSLASIFTLMRFLFSFSILGSSLLGLVMQSHAQTSEARTLATDTLQPANATYYMPVTRLRTTGGQLLYVFLRESSSGQTNVLEFTWRHPLTLPRPKPVTIKLEQVQWLSTNGQYYEPVRLVGVKAQLLAWRRSAGPRVELFDIAWPKNKPLSYVPIVGQAADLLGKRDSADYNHYWFVRRPGQQHMTFVPPKKEFAAFLADYLFDVPALAAAIRAGTIGYGYDDVPRLLRAYNQRGATPTAP